VERDADDVATSRAAATEHPKLGGMEAWMSPTQPSRCGAAQKARRVLAALFLGELLTASHAVLRQEIEKARGGLFLPLIHLVGGQLGVEASTLIIRGWPGEITLKQWWWVLRRG